MPLYTQEELDIRELKEHIQALEKRIDTLESNVKFTFEAVDFFHPAPGSGNTAEEKIKENSRMIGETTDRLLNLLEKQAESIGLLKDIIVKHIK